MDIIEKNISKLPHLSTDGPDVRGRGLGSLTYPGALQARDFYEASAVLNSYSTCHNKRRPFAEHTNVVLRAFAEQRDRNEEVSKPPLDSVHPAPA